jgi:hypothetical protein
MVPSFPDRPIASSAPYCATGWDAVLWGRRNNISLLAGEFGASAALNPAARLA